MSHQTSAKSAEALTRELEYQREHAEALEMVAATPAKVIERYASLRYAGIIQKDFMSRELGVGRDLNGKKLLDFGCGTGETSKQLAARAFGSRYGHLARVDRAVAAAGGTGWSCGPYSISYRRPPTASARPRTRST